MQRIEFDWDTGEDFDKFRVKVKQASRKVDSEALFVMYEARFRRYMHDLFETEGASGGEPWAKLSEGYIQWKGHARIGVLTDEMRQSLTGGEGYYKRITKSTLEMGQRRGAAPHTKWFRNGRKPRPIEMSTTERRIWTEMAKMYYGNSIRNALDPHAKRRSIRLPDGSLAVVYADGSVHARSAKGQFIKKAAEKLALKPFSGGFEGVIRGGIKK